MQPLLRRLDLADHPRIVALRLADVAQLLELHELGDRHADMFGNCARKSAGRLSIAGLFGTL